jgi:hypothetical protein
MSRLTTTFSTAGELLRHPFAMLVATALVSTLPITSWQNHQRQNGVKAALVADLSKESAQMLIAAQFDEFGGPERDPKVTAAAFKNWAVQEVMISARLRAHIKDPAVSANWDELAAAFTNVYKAGRQANGFDRQSSSELREYVGSVGIDWSALDHGYPKLEEFPPYNAAWFALRRALLQRLGEVTQQVLDASVR